MPVTAAPFVKKTLVPAVPGAFGFEQPGQVVKLVLAWGENENARVENVGPAHIWSGGEIMGEIKKVRKRADWEDVGIEKNNFRVLGQSENMQFSKDGGEVGTT
jgi:hypothetical protein